MDSVNSCDNRFQFDIGIGQPGDTYRQDTLCVCANVLNMVRKTIRYRLPSEER